MKIISTSGIDYVPEWNGNRKLPEAQQIIVVWNYLTGVERESVIGFEPIKFGADGELKGEYSFRLDNVNLLKKSVKGIKNLSVQEGEKERPANVEDICNLPELAGLYRELVDFFMEQNRTEGKKK